MAIYERGSGLHTAERVRPVPGSDDEARYAALADDPGSGWRRVEDKPTPKKPKKAEPPKEPEEPKAPAKSASKADWVAYAAAQGMEQADAEAMTRDDLAAKYLAEGGVSGAGDQ